MFVTYSFWIRADKVHTGGKLVGGETNYQIDMSRDRARELYAELKKEFG